VKRKLLVVDCETGGTDAEKHSLLSIAALVVADGAVIDEYYTLINEGDIVAEVEALKINGLDLAVVRKEGASPSNAVTAITTMLTKHSMRGGANVVAHNAAFDMTFLKRLFRLAGVDFRKWIQYRALCTVTGALLLEQAGRIVLPGGSASLDALCKLWNLPRSPVHNALEDARVTAVVFRRMIDLLQW
jgi:DNA polymerase-3 subunit epsilon